MKFALALFSAPHNPSSRRALKFAQAALNEGHEIVRVFFYQDAVQHFSASAVIPQDEQNQAAAWREFIQSEQIDAVVCIAAALRRGILDNAEAQRYSKPASMLEGPWELSGLGQLHEANQLADRLICFGGEQ